MSRLLMATALAAATLAVSPHAQQPAPAPAQVAIPSDGSKRWIG